MLETKQNVLSLIEVMLRQGILTSQELSCYAKPVEEDLYDPEFVRQDLEQWYRNLGLESILDRKLTLTPCPFTRAEIEEAHCNQEIILCVPRDVNRRQLAAPMLELGRISLEIGDMRWNRRHRRLQNLRQFQ